MSESNKNSKVIESVLACKNEAEQAKSTRMSLNRKNFDAYHLRGDFSHKIKGQSTEFLPAQSQAVEQITHFIHQGIVDIGDFFSVKQNPGFKQSLFTPDEKRKIILMQLEKAGFYTFIHDAIKSGLLGSLMIAKVHGEYVLKPRYFARTNKATGESKLYQKKDKAWQLRIDNIRQRDYYPDPNGKLYDIQNVEMDLWEIKKLAKDNPDYDMKEIAKLSSGENSQDDTDKSRETGQNASSKASFRKRVKLSEFWGMILDPQSGDVLHEQVCCVVADDTYLIVPPVEYPSWSKKNPFVVSAIIRVPFSKWHRALMDAATALNFAKNEVFNLILDAGIQDVFGIKQLREHWLEDPSQVNEGIAPGTTLSVNQQCPPGMKVLERVDTGSMGQSGATTYELITRESNQATFTNDLRLGGLPPRAVKATEVVEASNSINSVFTGIGKNIETDFIEKLLEKADELCAQHIKDMDKDELISILGEKKVEEIFKLSDKQIFARTVGAHTFKVFGVSRTLKKMEDYRKLTTMLQTVSGIPTLQEAFTKKYDFTKLLQKIMESLDVDVDEISNDEADQAMNDAANAVPGPAGAPQEPGASSPSGPDLQSQLPQIASLGQGDVSQIPQTNFQ